MIHGNVLMYVCNHNGLSHAPCRWFLPHVFPATRCIGLGTPCSSPIFPGLSSSRCRDKMSFPRRMYRMMKQIHVFLPGLQPGSSTSVGCWRTRSAAWCASTFSFSGTGMIGLLFLGPSGVTRGHTIFLIPDYYIRFLSRTHWVLGTRSSTSRVLLTHAIALSAAEVEEII